MQLTQRYRIDKDSITYRIIDNEAVILNLDSGYYYSLNKVGTKIWLAIDKQKNIDEILVLLKEEYRVPKEQLKTDLMQLLSDLEKEELIKNFS